MSGQSKFDRTTLCADFDPVTNPVHPVTALCIPTRDRPDTLKRCLQSYIENTLRFDRMVSLIVMDDARTDDEQNHTLNTLKALLRRYKVPMRYTDRTTRLDYADRLARFTGMDPALIRFALLGDARCSTSFGANRNAMLIDTAGSCTVQVDDDTVCRIAPTPDLQDGIALRSTFDPNSYRFAPNRQAALEEVAFAECDFLALHEQLLGRKAVSVLCTANEEVVCDAASDAFLARLSEHQPVIRMTTLGSVGDSGMGRRAFLYMAKDAAFNDLVADEAGYRSKSNSRQMVKAPMRTTLNDRIDGMAMNMGLDHRTLLPPFMPVHRNEDGVFCAVLETCFPEAISGHLPFMIDHDPPGVRKPAPLQIHFRVNDLLLMLIRYVAYTGLHLYTPNRLTALGHFLTQTAAQPLQSFMHFLHELCNISLKTRLTLIERRLDETGGQPFYWADDLQTMARSIQSVQSDLRLCAPADIDGSEEEKWTLFQEWVGRYGTLLIHWADLVEAAMTLRDQGLRLTTEFHG